MSSFEHEPPDFYEKLREVAERMISRVSDGPLTKDIPDIGTLTVSQQGQEPVLNIQIKSPQGDGKPIYNSTYKILVAETEPIFQEAAKDGSSLIPVAQIVFWLDAMIAGNKT